MEEERKNSQHNLPHVKGTSFKMPNKEQLIRGTYYRQTLNSMP